MDHEACAYTAAEGDPDALVVFQQYASRGAAASFLPTPAYLDYLAESERLLAGPPEVVALTPLWSKGVGPAS